MSGQSSGSMWADMLGIGPVLAAVNDPNFHLQIKSFVAALAATQECCIRIELKLDALLRAHNVDHGVTGPGAAAVPAQLGTPGTGPAAAAGGAADDGTGGDAEAARRTGTSG